MCVAVTWWKKSEIKYILNKLQDSHIGQSGLVTNLKLFTLLNQPVTWHTLTLRDSASERPIVHVFEETGHRNKETTQKELHASSEPSCDRTYYRSPLKVGVVLNEALCCCFFLIPDVFGFKVSAVSCVYLQHGNIKTWLETIILPHRCHVHHIQRGWNTHAFHVKLVQKWESHLSGGLRTSSVIRSCVWSGNWLFFFLCHPIKTRMHILWKLWGVHMCVSTWVVTHKHTHFLICQLTIPTHSFPCVWNFNK